LTERRLAVRDDWRRYVAPAAFLLAVTVAVILIRSGMDAGSHSPAASSSAPPARHVKVATKTAPTTTAARPKKHATAVPKQYWTVQAGDTFGVISSKTGVPVATIEQLNPTVQSTSLFIGEKIRIK
jgi:LysM repeat protein